MIHSTLKIFACFSLLMDLSLVPSVFADEPTAQAQHRFFEVEVRPLLAKKCWECHGPDKQKGELRLDSLNAMLSSDR